MPNAELPPSNWRPGTAIRRWPSSSRPATIVRLFLALNIPAAERRTIGKAIAPMRNAGADIRWMPEAQLHLTLKFLGEQPADAVAPLETALARVAADHAAFPFTLSGLGAFPNLRAPRIVWLGVTPDPKLELLQHDVERTCADLGFPLDARAFRPHITLGRARDGVSPDAARAMAAAARQVRFATTVAARSLDVMESRLGARGARHTLVAALPLGGA
jgi:2'-5' RNA ligase